MTDAIVEQQGEPKRRREHPEKPQVTDSSSSSSSSSSSEGSTDTEMGLVEVCTISGLYDIQVHGGRYFLHTHSHSADSWEQSTVVDFMNRFPDTFQTVTDWSLFGQDVPHGVNTLTRWLTNSGCIAQALSSSTRSFTVRQTIPAITVRLECCGNDGPDATSSVFAEAGHSCG